MASQPRLARGPPGRPALSAQNDAGEFVGEHLQQLLSSVRSDGGASRIGFLDLRLPYGRALRGTPVDELVGATRGPLWARTDASSLPGRIAVLQTALAEWGFPPEFIHVQIRELVELSLPSGRLHGANRWTLVVACGHEPAVAETHPMKFVHSIVLLGGSLGRLDGGASARDAPPAPPAEQ